MARLRVLVYGYGNPGRRDDGLGVLFAERVAALGLPGVTTDTNYQLNAEDALAVSEHDVVVFVDATLNDVGAYRLSKLEPSAEVEFTTHAMKPSSVLALCEDIYARHPLSFLLEIAGSDWEMGEGLSEQAEANLESALEWFVPMARGAKWRG